MHRSSGESVPAVTPELRVHGALSSLRADDLASAVHRLLSGRAVSRGNRVVLPHLLQLFVCPELDAAVADRRETLRAAAQFAIGSTARALGGQLLDAPQVEWLVLGLQEHGTISLHPSFGPHDVAASPAPARAAPLPPPSIGPSRATRVQRRQDEGLATRRLPSIGPSVDGLGISELGSHDAVPAAKGAIWGLLVDAVGQRYPLRGAVLVGRAPDADLLVTDPTVSARHARMTPQPDGTGVVSDLGSTNGTSINGRAIRQAKPLRSGDIVSFGSLRLRFEALR